MEGITGLCMEVIWSVYLHNVHLPIFFYMFTKVPKIYFQCADN